MTDLDGASQSELISMIINLREELERAKRERDQYQSEKWKYGGQLGNVNKILDEDKPGCTYDELATFNAERLDRLRDVLSPRKETGETKT
jgi:hypothetical protein